MSTFIIESMNFKVISTKMLYVVIKNLFKYGVKDVKRVHNQVHLYLNYHPKNTTVEEKLGMLPVRYLRISANDDEELQLFFRAINEFPTVKKYLMEKREEAAAATENALEEAEPQKKVNILENRLLRSARSASSREEEDELEGEPNNKKKMKLEKRVTKPVPSNATDFLETFDPNDDFESHVININDEGNVIDLND